jgi:hypothetical protein
MQGYTSMANWLLRTEVAVSDCEGHLTVAEAIGTPIESYLTEHVLVLFSRDVQQAIYKIVDQSASGIAHQGIKSFVSQSCKKVIRGAKETRSPV